ncbi:Uncharacterised protein [Escherichia coli]|nr:Uncharacterised protein [Escherichia coli]SQY66892.1 Uncharacterised protein [Escherichia coli]SQZ03827.1 Uncharacterised protein [Escherichia coli]SRY22663.1 Uncharacterised protein [Escherichia coli]
MPLPKTTNLFMAGYRTTNLTFTGNPKTFIRAIPTTRHYPNSEETPEPLKPQRSLLPQGFSQSQKTRNITITGNAITQYTNNYKSPSHTPDKQLKHNNERIRPPAITPYTEKNNHQNDENTPQKNHRKTNETIYTDRENNTSNSPTEIVAV